jgi:hypothetical protein
MPVDLSLVGRVFGPTSPYAVTKGKVSEFLTATGITPQDEDNPVVPATFPIVLAFDAMNTFLVAERMDLSRIVHGEQRFAYRRQLRVGDILTARLTVTGVRHMGSADVIGTSSEILDADGELVCSTKATLVHSAGTA